VQCFGLFSLGFVWFFSLKIVYIIAEQITLRVFPKYHKMSRVERTDWTSRLVASFVILLGLYFTFRIKWHDEDHTLIYSTEYSNSTYDETTFLFRKEVSKDLMYDLYHFYALMVGYEMYDLKNCIDIKMTSGVIHHIVLIIMFPVGWMATILGLAATYMLMCSYVSNIPAHLRSFLLYTGHRDTKLYNVNKWAWWVGYVILRLFAIPWFSAQMYFALPALKKQGHMFAIVWYFSAMSIHYALSMYWFVGMSRTLFPPKGVKRVESFPALSGTQESQNAIPPRERKGSEDGGQKFD